MFVYLYTSSLCWKKDLEIYIELLEFFPFGSSCIIMVSSGFFLCKVFPLAQSLNLDNHKTYQGYLNLKVSKKCHPVITDQLPALEATIEMSFVVFD